LRVVVDDKGGQVSDAAPGDGAKVRLIALSVVISLVSIALGVLHIVYPLAKFDATTMGFLGIAILPWLLPYLKSAKLPGGVELEFKDFKREVKEQLATGVQRVEAVASQVQDVMERFAISGTTNEQVLRLLQSTLAGFHAYLVDVGFVLADKLRIRIEKSLETRASYYDPKEREIVVAEAYSGDSDLACRDYGHFALSSAAQQGGSPLESWTNADRAIESGLADYYACSYKDDPLLFGKSSAGSPRIESAAPPLDARDLSRRLGFGTESQALLARGEDQDFIDVGAVWAALFWALRVALGRRATDRLLLEVWATPHAKGKFADALRAAAMNAAGPERGPAVNEIFASRGA
jgi:hypothetical protein